MQNAARRRRTDCLRRLVARGRVGEPPERLEGRTLCSTTDLITNGSLPDATGWTVAGDWRVDSVYSTTNGRSNPGYAYLAKNGALAQSVNTAGSLAQTVTLPNNLSSATLSFYTKLTTEEATGSTNDALNVRVRSSGGTLLATLGTMSARTDSDYVASSYDLTAYAGQTVSISFEGSTNATLGTVFRVDDVSLLATTAANGLIAPTPVTPGVASGTTPTIHSPLATLRWDPVSTAAGYGVQLQSITSGPFPAASTIFDSESSTFASPIAGTSLTIPKPLSAGITYRWHVRAFDSHGNASGYSPWMTFTVTPSGFNRAVGIDISDYQTVSNWNSVKTNGTSGTTTDDTSFVYVKATEGLGFDATKFAGFFDGAVSAGIAVGAYHFARPGNNSASSEATHFYNVIKSRLSAGNLVPMLDFEDPASNTVSMSVAALSKWVNDFENAFTALSGGIVPIVYTFVSYASAHLDTSVLKFPLWQAQYPGGSTIPLTSGSPSGTDPWPGGAWAMWQSTDARSVAGVGTVDSDVSNSDFATFYDQFKIRSNAKGSISGTVFNDANGNGVQDAGEAALAGRTVWLDADDDGILDGGEATAVTGPFGTYSFSNLPEGAYKVRQVVPDGFAATAPSNGVAVVTLTPGLAATGKDFATRSLDTTPPAIASADFDYVGASHAITLTLSEPLAAGSFTADDVALVDANGAAVPFGFAFDNTTGIATLTPTGQLADGSYRLSIAAGAFTDLAGNANAAYSFDFFQLAGDVNRDRSVDFSDLLILAKNYGTSGATFTTGDVTGDGRVNFDDLLILAKNYSATAPAIAATPNAFALAAAPATSTSRRRVATTVL